MKEKLKRRGGFTLAELLIVVAIIAVLVAIAIPVFSSELEKAREAVDAANIRAAYAEIMVKAVEDPTQSYTQDVKLKQMEEGWQNTELKNNLESLFVGEHETTHDMTSDVQGEPNNISSGHGYNTATIEWKNEVKYSLKPHCKLTYGYTTW